MQSEHNHRCETDGKKRSIATKWDRDAEWYMGYCSLCDGWAYFEKDGEEITQR